MGDELFAKKENPSAPAMPGIADVGARLKVLEERYTNLSRREQLAEQNMLSFEKEINSEIKAIQKRILETRKHVSDVNEKLEVLQGQVANAATKHDLRILEAYLNMIQPMEFVTRAEAKKLLERTE